MKLILNKVVRVYKQLRGLLPSPLPTGSGAFDAWVEDIRSTYVMPTEDSDSIHFSFAAMIMHLGPTAASKPKYYFVLAIRASAAKQVAGSAFHAVKIRQKELAEAQQAAAAAQLKAEATASVAAASAQTN